jgi:hypothetical protein
MFERINPTIMIKNAAKKTCIHEGHLFVYLVFAVLNGIQQVYEMVYRNTFLLVILNRSFPYSKYCYKNFTRIVPSPAL